MLHTLGTAKGRRGGENVSIAHCDTFQGEKKFQLGNFRTKFKLHQTLYKKKKKKKVAMMCRSLSCIRNVSTIQIASFHSLLLSMHFQLSINTMTCFLS